MATGPLITLPFKKKLKDFSKIFSAVTIITLTTTLMWAPTLPSTKMIGFL